MTVATFPKDTCSGRVLIGRSLLTPINGKADVVHLFRSFITRVFVNFLGVTMSNREKLELLIKEQGDIVRKLKQAKENKDKVRVVLHHADF